MKKRSNGAREPAAAKRAKQEAPAILRLAYTLAELPSSQHRAGLAGLVVALRYLQRIGHGGVASIDAMDDAGATFTFDRAGMQALFDLIYAASTVEVAATSPYKDKAKNVIEPIRIEERTVLDARTKRESVKKYFIYPQIVPRAEVVLDVDPTRADSAGLWVKLWRDAIWSILRGVPAQRAPFEARAENAKTHDADDVFEDLSHAVDQAVPLPSTFFLGAMDKSAEDVPFRDRARFQLLLHFWPIVSSIFVPETEDREGKREFWGYAFAIPDVSSLDSFCTVWNEAMRSRGIGPTAYLPREAVVALCREAGLAALARLRSRLSAIQASDVAEVVLAFDVIHAEKPGNAVKITEVGRIEPRAQMIDEYERLRSALWDHAFRRQRIENLLEGTPWYGGFDRLLRTLPYERILGRQFAHDAAIEFEHVLSEKGDRGMAEPKDLEEIVLAVATSYVARRVSSKNGLTWADAKGDPAKEREYAETKEKAAKGAFLAIRSRTGADFVDYFAGTLCSVPQRLSNDDFSTLSRALRERPDEVRTLTMLALSARS